MIEHNQILEHHAQEEDAEECEGSSTEEMSDEDIERAAQRHMDNLVDGFFDNVLVEVTKEDFVFTDADSCGDIRLQAMTFIGTIMAISPSGKYYLPFACSNVTEDEAAIDEAFWEKFEKELSDRGLFLTSSEGCPTNMLVGADIPIDSIYVDMLDDLKKGTQSEHHEAALFFIENIFEEDSLNGDSFDELMDKIKNHDDAQEYLNKKCISYLRKVKEENT